MVLTHCYNENYSGHNKHNWFRALQARSNYLELVSAVCAQAQAVAAARKRTTKPTSNALLWIEERFTLHPSLSSEPMDLPSYEEAIKQPVEEGRAAKFCRQVWNHDFFLFEILEAGLTSFFCSSKYFSRFEITSISLLNNGNRF